MPFANSAVPQLDIALINWSGWPGFVKGALFSALDAAALAIYLSQTKTKRPIPFALPVTITLLPETDMPGSSLPLGVAADGSRTARTVPDPPGVRSLQPRRRAACYWAATAGG